jgi:hypothetical protein
LANNVTARTLTQTRIVCKITDKCSRK